MPFSHLSNSEIAFMQTLMTLQLLAQTGFLPQFVTVNIDQQSTMSSCYAGVQNKRTLRVEASRQTGADLMRQTNESEFRRSYMTLTCAASNNNS